MAHDLQKEYCLRIKELHPELFKNRFVLDVGSWDINGNNNHLFDNCVVIRNDIIFNDNVDIACYAHKLKFRDNYFNTIISTECFEHDPFFPKTIKNIFRMLAPGGLFIFTAAGSDRAEHYEALTNYQDTYYYKNVTEEMITSNINMLGFESYKFEHSDYNQDIYFWGIKSG